MCKTLLAVPGLGTYEIIVNPYGGANWVRSCDLCELRGANRCHEVYCEDFDTLDYSVYFKRLAKPLSAQNTPSEARREAATL